MKNIFNETKNTCLNWYKDNKTVLVALIIVFIFGFLLRIATLENNLLFGFEQGRDALKATDIYNLKDIVLIGPKTDIDGIFHGVWFYYLLAFLYFIMAGNPLFVTYALAFINALSIFVVYAIARNISLSKNFAIFSAVLFAVSFNTVGYARWLSNVSPSIFVVAAFALSTILLVKHRKDAYWIPTMALFALLFHFEVLHGLYGMVILMIFTAIFQLPIFTKNFFKGVAIFLIINIPFFVFDIKNEFILTKGVIHYLTSPSNSLNPAIAIGKYLYGLSEELESTLYTKMTAVPFLTSILLFVYAIRSTEAWKTRELKALFIFLFWTFPYIFLLRLDPLHQFYAGTSIFIILIFAYSLHLFTRKIDPKYSSVFMVIVTLTMMLGTYSNISKREMVFYHKTHKDMTYADQKKIIEKMIESGKTFEWEAFTIPYYHSDAYQYLISWYGRQLIGNKIDTLLSSPEKENYFLITEPSTQGYWLDKWFDEKNVVSKRISTDKFGEMTLEIRKKTTK